MTNHFELLNPSTPTSSHPHASPSAITPTQYYAPSRADKSTHPNKKIKANNPPRQVNKRSLADSPETLSKVEQYIKDTTPNDSTISNLPISLPDTSPALTKQIVQAVIHTVPTSLPPTPLPSSSDNTEPLTSRTSLPTDCITTDPTSFVTSPQHSNLDSLIPCISGDTNMPQSPSSDIDTLPVSSSSDISSSHSSLSPLSLPMPPGFNHLRIPSTTSPITSVNIPTVITKRR